MRWWRRRLESTAKARLQESSGQMWGFSFEWERWRERGLAASRAERGERAYLVRTQRRWPAQIILAPRLGQ